MMRLTKGCVRAVWGVAIAVWTTGTWLPCTAAPGENAPQLAPSAAGLPNPIEFNQHIRPILADHCYLCHGPDKGTRKAGLRLDNRDSALRGVRDRPALVPGDSQSSEVIKRITSRDPAYAMPPRQAGPPLPPQQIALIRRWIDAGAPYEKHWAYLAPRKKAPPSTQDSTWVRNPVDAFIRADLEKEGLSPTPEADRRTLIRRVYFDLIGLPPSPREVEAFVGDQSPGAWDRLVDRLLASEHFGERLAVYWLDLVRYADTVGYHGDQDLDSWPFRDYVIRSFNQNLPFDQFTCEQLAGDLLPNATPQQKVASAYNRLNMVTREGGAQAKEYLAKYAADRVRTTSTVWMAATLGCAQCHDHKFDPFTTKDFYTFSAFFADIKEEGVYQSDAFNESFPPVIRVPSPEQQKELDKLEARLAAVEKEALELKRLQAAMISAAIPYADNQREAAAWLGQSAADLTQALADWERATRQRLESHAGQEIPLVVEDDVQGGKRQDQWRLVDQARNQPAPSGKRIREQASDGLVQHFAIDFPNPHPVQRGERLYAFAYLDPQKMPATLMLQWDTGGQQWQHRAYWGQDLIAFGTLGKDSPDHRRIGDLPAPGRWLRLEVDPGQVGLKEGDAIRGIAFTQQGGRVWWDTAGLASQYHPPEAVAAALKKDAAAREDRDLKTLLAHYFEAQVMTRAEATRLAARREKEAFAKTLPVCVVTESVKPREIRVLPRGNWMDDSGEVVTPALPRFLSPPVPGAGSRLTRLDLARWLVSRDNPLTARVMVNRLWKLYFGTGLSKGLDDLGSRGEWPRHLDLLDWLAVEFMDSGWDVKHLVRLLVTSSTYRLTSKPSERLREMDPYNRLYARQSRPRLEAEFVRDNALAISDLLVPKIGGPSVKPYQPLDYYRELNFPKRTYVPDVGENQYRRGLYTHWQRTFLHPSLLAFDAPPREECTAERTASNTPLQALALLNDPTYVEAARVFAAHILEGGGTSFESRLAWAYRRALSRPPTPGEAAILRKLLDQQLAEFKVDTAAAAQLVRVGQAPGPDRVDVPEWAAWTSVSRALLNQPEIIVRY